VGAITILAVGCETTDHGLTFAGLRPRDPVRIVGFPAFGRPSTGGTMEGAVKG
jgi:hypothetical protein